MQNSEKNFQACSLLMTTNEENIPIESLNRIRVSYWHGLFCLAVLMRWVLGVELDAKQELLLNERERERESNEWGEQANELRTPKAYTQCWNNSRHMHAFRTVLAYKL